MNIYSIFRVLKTLDKISNGKEIIFLTDGESNSILGPLGDLGMAEMSQKTGEV